MMTSNPIRQFQGQYRFLASFHPASLVIAHIKYQTSEHAYQAFKARSAFYRLKIAKADTPGKAKKIGRSIVCRDDWDDIKISVMHAVVFQKFSQNENIRYSLLNTDNRLLEEGNHWDDTFWGVDINTGEGENYLGLILMEVRSIFKFHWDTYEGKQK